MRVACLTPKIFPLQNFDLLILSNDYDRKICEKHTMETFIRMIYVFAWISLICFALI